MITIKTTTVGRQKDGTLVPVTLDLDSQALVENLQASIDAAHQVAVDRGWWTKLSKVDDCGFGLKEKIDLRVDYPAGGRPGSEKNVGDQISLIHTEISEAYEGHRTNSHDDKLPEYLALEVELADAVIRIFDSAGGMKLRLAECIAFKLAYNSVRTDHSHEARNATDGKKT